MQRAEARSAERANGSVGPVIERGVLAVGDTADRWLESHGYLVSPESRAGRLAADVVHSEGLTVARIWHSFSHLISCAAGTVHDLVLVLVLEGTVQVESSSERFTIEKGEGYLRPSSIEVALETRGSTATIEILLGAGFERRFGLTARWEAAPLSATGAVRFLTASSNAVFSACTAAGPGWQLWLLALEAAAAGTLLEAGASLPMTSPAEAALVQHAQRIIREHCTSPQLTVSALAARVSISERRLFEAFAAAGTTPRAEIERTRLAIVRRLSAGSCAGHVDWDELARRSGFRSGRSLRAALRNRA